MTLPAPLANEEDRPSAEHKPDLNDPFVSPAIITPELDWTELHVVLMVHAPGKVVGGRIQLTCSQAAQKEQRLVEAPFEQPYQ